MASRRNTLNQDRLMWLGAASPVLRLPAPVNEWATIYNPQNGQGPGQKGSVDLGLTFSGAFSDLNIPKIKIFLNGTRIDPVTTPVAINDGDNLLVWVYARSEDLPAPVSVTYVFTGQASAPGDAGFPVTHSMSYTAFVGGFGVSSTSYIPSDSQATSIDSVTLLQTSVTESSLAYGASKSMLCTWLADPSSGDFSSINFTMDVLQCEMLERFQYLHRPDVGLPRTVYPDAFRNSVVSVLAYQGFLRYQSGPLAGPVVTQPVDGTVLLSSPSRPGCIAFPAQQVGIVNERYPEVYTYPSQTYQGRAAFNAGITSVMPADNITTCTMLRVSVSLTDGPYQQAQNKGAGGWTNLIGSAAIVANDFEIITDTDDVTNTNRIMTIRGEGHNEVQTTFYCDGSPPTTMAISGVNWSSIDGAVLSSFEANAGQFAAAVNYLRQYVDPETPEAANIPQPVMITVDGTMPLTDEEFARLTAGVNNTSIDYDDQLDAFLAENPDIAAKISSTNYQVNLQDPIITASLGLDPNAFTVLPGSITGEMQLNTELTIGEIAKLGLTIYSGFSGLKTLLAVAGNLAVLSSPLGVIATVMAGIKVYKASTAIEGVLSRDTDVYRIPQDMSLFIAKHPEFRPNQRAFPPIPGGAVPPTRIP